MTAITDRLPYPLSERIAGATSGLYNPQGREVDVAIAGIPFRLATTTDLPQSIETIPVQRDQFDAENDPGEQSLTSWWRRSQSSWHDGAGDLYQENSDRTIDSTSYWDSSGMDVFTQGQMTLLKRMGVWPSTPANCRRMNVYTDGGATAVSVIAEGDLYTAATVGGALSVMHNPTTTLVDGVLSGTTFYDVASDGTLYQGDTSSPGTATTWPLGAGPTRLGWGKFRLWVIGGRKLWQPDLTLAGGTSQSPIFTHPNPGWTFTCMAEGSSAMLFGGHDGRTSTIQSITLDTGGGLPTLSGAAMTAALPDGELIQELAVLAGQYVGIGTSRGFRVGTMDSTGNLTYGPLIVEPEGVTGCTALTAQGRFFVVAFATDDDQCVAYRVDTGTPLDGGIFPYARDIACDTAGAITSLASPTNKQLVCTTTDGDAWVQSLTDYVDSGWLQTGRIRYRTTDMKSFKFVTVEIEPLRGNIAVSLIKEGGSTEDLGNITVQGEVFTDKLGISVVPMRHASVRFTMTPTAGKTQAPILHSYQLRAFPSVAPQRMITLPLLCFDREQARSGQWYGGKNFAADRLQALMTLEDLAEPLVYQDFTSVGGVGRQVLIEGLRFVQTSPGLPYRASTGGAGGIILLQLRTVDS